LVAASSDQEPLVHKEADQQVRPPQDLAIWNTRTVFQVERSTTNWWGAVSLVSRYSEKMTSEGDYSLRQTLVAGNNLECLVDNK